MTQQRIVLASNNHGKIAEIQLILSDLNIELISQKQANIEDIEETGKTFVENAILKARNACQISGYPAIADDSGLEVDALNGRPGIYSARFAGIDATDDDNNNQLLQELNAFEHNQRSARFRCAIVYMRHANDPAPELFFGCWQGHIATKLTGEHGFGYDPLFIPEGLSISAAQLTKEEKNRLSHRAQAIKQLKHFFLS